METVSNMCFTSFIQLTSLHVYDEINHLILRFQYNFKPLRADPIESSAECVPQWRIVSSKIPIQTKRLGSGGKPDLSCSHHCPLLSAAEFDVLPTKITPVRGIGELCRHFQIRWRFVVLKILLGTTCFDVLPLLGCDAFLAHEF
jgi:hypothetical protein